MRRVSPSPKGSSPSPSPLHPSQSPSPSLYKRTRVRVRVLKNMYSSPTRLQYTVRLEYYITLVRLINDHSRKLNKLLSFSLISCVNLYLYCSYMLYSADGYKTMWQGKGSHMYEIFFMNFWVVILCPVFIH